MIDTVLQGCVMGTLRWESPRLPGGTWGGSSDGEGGVCDGPSTADGSSRSAMGGARTAHVRRKE